MGMKLAEAGNPKLMPQATELFKQAAMLGRRDGMALYAMHLENGYHLLCYLCVCMNSCFFNAFCGYRPARPGG